MENPVRPTPPIQTPGRVLILALAMTACAGAGGPGVATEFDPSLGVDLAGMRQTESGLYIRTLEPGQGPAVRQGQIAIVHYVGWLSDGTQVDSSRERDEPLPIRLGDGRVIEGWDEGITGMRVGERRRLVVPPDLAYGSQGSPPTIPRYATLVFDIQLLGIR
jgi:FKBP-type peptidyl-prolyl cis-trans isomerase FkpA